MKRALVPFALMLVCSAAIAGVQYDFRSVTEGDGGGTSLGGTAWIEGENMRMEVTDGDDVIFKDRSVVISHDGGQNLTVLDPSEKSYYEIPVADLAGALGAMLQAMGGMVDLSFDNQNVEVTDEGAGPAIEGYSTHKYVIDAEYDIIMKMMGMNMNSHVTTRSEIWATDEIASDYVMFLQKKPFKTGIDDLDSMIGQYLDTVDGFPLKQVVHSTTTMRGRTQSTVTTMTVEGIEEMNIDDSRFEVPDGYRRTESPMPDLEGLMQQRR